MTTWARTEAPPTRDELDELYPDRARRRVSTLADYPEHRQLGPRLWRTVAHDREATLWLAVTEERDPFVVKLRPTEDPAEVSIARSGRVAAAPRGVPEAVVGPQDRPAVEPSPIFPAVPRRGAA